MTAATTSLQRNIFERFECDNCDGCGWYEGGKTLQTTCEKCDGTGIVEKVKVLDIEAGREAKERGMKLACASKNELVDKVREAMVIQALWGDVTADDAREWLIKEGYEQDALGNAMGSVFKCAQFVPKRSSEGFLIRVPSKVPENHARLVQVWRLR